MDIFQLDSSIIEQHAHRMTLLQSDLCKAMVIDEMTMPEILEHFNLTQEQFQNEMIQIIDISRAH